MQAATRLGLAFLLLIAAFLALAGFAVWGLVAAGQSALAMVVVVAGVAGVLAGVLTWLVLRREEDEPLAQQAQAPAPPQPVIARRAVRVQSMPVADLPAAYVDAVTRGMRERTTALQAQASELRH